MDHFEKKVMSYLERSAKESGMPWRNKSALLETIEDVKKLDDDLKVYVKDFLEDETNWQTSLGCDVVSINTLVEIGMFTPVAAALFIQWYRDEPRQASLFLLQNDTIKGIPEKIPEEKDESEN
jgi:hypothetical protein